MQLALPRLYPKFYDRQVAARIALTRLHRWRSFRRTLHTKLSQVRDAAQNLKEGKVLSKMIDYPAFRQPSPKRLWSDSFFVVRLIPRMPDLSLTRRGLKMLT